MKRTSLREKGITLVALVVTIIVLLILAAISIASLTGEKGLLNRAVGTKDVTERAQIIESAKIDILDKIAENNGADITESQFIDVLKKYFVENDIPNEIPEDLTTLKMKSLNGRHEILASEIYDGNFKLEKAKGDGRLSTGDGSEDNPYQIQSIEDLVTLSNNVLDGNTYQNKTLKLLISLDFKNSDSYLNSTRKDFGDVNGNGTIEELMTELTTSSGFRPIGTDSKVFMGTFDGNNKSINNLYENVSDSSYMGFFGDVTNITVKDFKLKSVNLTFYKESGGLIGRYSGMNQISNFTIDGTISANNDKIGGIAGLTTNASIEISNSTNLCNITAGSFLGGFIGYPQGSVKLTSCTNMGKIHGGHEVGGMIGQVENAYLNITNCSNEKDIEGQQYIGGIVGFLYNGGFNINNTNNKAKIKGTYYVAGITGINSSGSLNIENSYNDGDIEGTSYVSGLVGSHGGPAPLNVKNSYNLKSIKGNEYIGGIAGLASVNLQIENCYNKGTINCQNLYGGGIIGCGANNGSNIKYCYNTNKIEGKSSIGGIIGKTAGNDEILVQYCYNKGEIVASTWQSDVGGIVGSAMSVNISDCYNRGNVTGGCVYISGILGSNYGGTVSNCYNTGTITRKITDTVLGVYGIGGKTVKNSYNAGAILNNGTGDAAPSAISTGTLTECYYLAGTAPKANANEDDSNGKGKSIENLATLKNNMNDYFKALDGWNEAENGINDEYPTLEGVPND